MSGGVALFDFDHDGRTDMYLVDSLTVDTANDPKAARSALYRNLGGGKFSDVTDRAGVGHPGWGMGVCIADVDADGWDDMYVTALGGNKLYRNNHDGTFGDVTAAAGVQASGWSAGCAFGDYDRDGDLDLFVSRYVKIDLNNLPQFGKDKTCEYRGVAVQCGPRGLPGEGDFLFRNEGNGRFTEVSEAAGVSEPRAYFGLGAAWFDYNGDQWPDLYVANDSTPHFLYENQKDGTFKEVAFPKGVAVSEDGADHGSTLIAVGDYDNDTWPDIIVVNGHVYPQLDQARLGASAGYRQRKLLYHNKGDGTFDEVAAKYGPVLTDLKVSRGLAVGDLDDDGRLDVVINDLDGAPQILHNEIATRGNWLIVKVKGKGKNTNAIGAIITVTTGTTRQMRLIQSGTSYISQDDMRQHFGLGAASRVDAIEVKWPDGTTTVRKDVAAGQVVTIEQ